MISEKEYLSLIKQLPYQHCPKELMTKVIKKCGFSKNAVNENPTNLFAEIKYGFACLTIICFVLGVGLGQKDYSKAYTARLALNAKTFLGQLTNNACAAFSGWKQIKKG